MLEYVYGYIFTITEYYTLQLSALVRIQAITQVDNTLLFAALRKVLHCVAKFGKHDLLLLPHPHFKLDFGVPKCVVFLHIDSTLNS